MRNFKTDSIIIKRRNVGEADRLITIFTKFGGKFSIKAPGVRRITSRRSSHIELLNLSTLTLYNSSRTSVPILIEAQMINDFEAIKTDLKKIGFAFYICELIDKLCPDNQENRGIFYLIKETFEKLEVLQNGQKLIDEFEERALILLGFMPQSYFISDRHAFIEQILERKINTRRILPLLV